MYSTKKVLEIKNDELDKILKSKNISNKKYITIHPGQSIISNEYKLFYFVGGGNMNKNQLEISSIFCNNECFFKRRQMQVSVSTIINNYKLCEVDELGKIYNIRKIAL